MSPRRRPPAAPAPRPARIRSADCQSRLKQLLDYLDGELTGEQAARLERHLDQCPCCGDLAASLRQAIALCRSAGRQGLPPQVQRRARLRARQLLDRGEES